MRLSAKVGAIEFVGDEVRLVVVKGGSRRPKVLERHACLARYEAPEQRFDAMVAAVQAVMDGVEARPSAYVLCVSSFYSVVRFLAIPFRGQRRVQAAVPFELERYLAFPIEDLVVDSITVSEAKSETQVLAVGMRRDVLADQLAILKAAGVDPEGIDVDAAGLTGLWHDGQPALKGLHAVLHARESGSVLAITYNKSLVYFRSLSLSGAQVCEDPLTAAREIQNSLRAFHANWKDDSTVASLTVTGVRFSEEADTLFAHEFEIPVACRPLLEGLESAPRMIHSIGEIPSAVAAGAETAGAETADAAVADAVDAEYVDPPNGWEAAIGAACGASGGGFSMNFRKGELSAASPLRSLVPHVLFTSCIAIVLLAGAAWYYHDARARNLVEVARLKDQISAVEKEVEDLQGQGISVSSEAFSDANLLDILSAIAAAMPDGKAAITEIIIEPSGSAAPWITIMGEVKEDAQFAAAVAALRQSALFNVDEPDLKLVEGRSTFRITARRFSGNPAKP